MNGTRQHGGDRASNKKSQLRRGTQRTADGHKSSRERCPKCKKLRRRWITANDMHSGRKLWARIEKDQPKVCHICVARHLGAPLPIVQGAPKQKKFTQAQPPQLP